VNGSEPGGSTIMIALDMRYTRLRRGGAAHMIALPQLEQAPRRWRAGARELGQLRGHIDLENGSLKDNLLQIYLLYGCSISNRTLHQAWCLRDTESPSPNHGAPTLSISASINTQRRSERDRGAGQHGSVASKLTWRRLTTSA